ncbi:MAG: methyltransferase domain-containing protein [Candidatus Omnitrophota bacterium]
MNYKTIIANNFSKAAKTYDEYAVFQNNLAQTLKQKILNSRCAADTVLDIGTGTGTLALELAKIFPKAAIHGCDIADGMLDVARKKSAAIDNFVCVRADAEHLPYKNNVFSIVASSAALHWASSLPAAILELTRVLAAGGRLFATFMVRGTLFELHDSLNTNPFLPEKKQLLGIIENCGLCKIESFQIEEKIYYKSPRELLLSLKRTGTNYSRGAAAKKTLSRALDVYKKKYAGNSGIPATFKALLIKAENEN